MKKKVKAFREPDFHLSPRWEYLAIAVGGEEGKKTFYARGVSCTVSRKMKFWFTLVFQSMLWFGLVSVTAACLTRITPDPEVPLRGGFKTPSHGNCP